MTTPLQKILGEKRDGWERSWAEGVTPWDAGCAAPVLVDLVRRGALPASGRALVPGVGSGYDALALASPTRTVVGVDISPTAVNVALARRQAQGVPASQCSFIAGDFFTLSLGTFDCIWDYTLFCALPPELRSRWATRMRELLAPGGELLTLIFPIGDFADGPPYAVSPQLYRRVLGEAGLEPVELQAVPDELSHSARRGKEWLGRWRVKGSGPPRL
jgi:hypothetical protein